MPLKSKPPKLSQAIKDAVEAYAFLKTPMELDLVNYSALARKLKPSLEKQLGEPLTVEAIAMALHRHARPDTPKKNGLFKMISECKIQLLPDMATMHFPYNRKLQEKLHAARAMIEHQGGNTYIIERTTEISIITQSQFVDTISRYAEDSKQLSQDRNLSLLTIQYPPEGNYVPGLFNYFTTVLGQAGINIYGMFSSYSKVSFLVDEPAAPFAYDKMTRALAAARSLE